MSQIKKWHVGWGPVQDCNLSCAFCYSKVARGTLGNIGFDDWINFIDDNHEFISDINYGTGENTLSLDWFRLVDYIRCHYPAIRQALTTNGYLIKQIMERPHLSQIIQKSIDEIDVSLDFSDAKTFCQFRGNRHVYDWARRTLQFCQDNSIISTIVFLGAKPTLQIENINGLFTLAQEHRAMIRMNIYRPTNPSTEINETFIASYEQILQALYHIHSNYKILSISDPLFGSILTSDRVEEDPSGQSSLRILHNGKITPSTYLISEGFQHYEIADQKVLSRIRDEDAFGYLNSIPDECKGCQFRDTCKGGVYDRRYLWYKDFFERDPYCPFREGNFLPIRLLTITSDHPFQSVHHGYLPSLFFSY